MFGLSVTKGSSSYVFDVVEERDEEFDSIELYIGNSSRFTKACVFMYIDPKTHTAVLQSAIYHATCSTNTSLASKTGTALMLQCAVNYVFDTYKHLKYIDLNDKSMVPNGNIHVTAKRLLQGRQGWYQEVLGAIPVANTIPLMQELKQSAAKIQEYEHITTKKEWGTQAEIEQLAAIIVPKFKESIVGTAWRIPRRDYGITVKKIDAKKGGTIQKASLKTKISEHTGKMFRSHLRLTKM
jgi:hypothetical protein